MAVIGNAPFQGLVSGGEILDASIEGVDLSTSAIAARLGYTPVDPGAAVFSANPTISSGTAGAVAYLNGNKVVTTNSALTFNGTYLNANGLRISGSDTSNTVYQATGSLVITADNSYLGLMANANNPIIFFNNSAEQMRLSSGVLSVGPSSGAGAVSIGSNVGRAQYQYINFGGAQGGVDYAWQIGRSPSGGVGPADGFYIYDLRANATRLAIDGSGRVGVGTTNPQGKLHVVADLNQSMSLVASASADGAISYTTSELRECAFNVTSGSNFRISNITTSATSWRAVFRGTWSNNYEGGGLIPPAPYIEVNSTNNSFLVGSRTLAVDRDANGYLVVSCTDAYRISFSGSIEIYDNPQSGQPANSIVTIGKVGVGLRNPSYPLEVAGGVASRGVGFILRNDAGSSNTGIFSPYNIINGSGTDYSSTIFSETGLGIYFCVNGSATRSAILNSSGNFGLGTTDINYRITNSGHLAFTTGSSNTDGAADAQRNGIGWQATGGSGVLGSFITANNQGNWGSDLQFFTRGASGGILNERMRITYDGNVLVSKQVTSVGTAGHTLGAGGYTYHTYDGGNVMWLNRLSNHGDIQIWQQGNSDKLAAGTYNGSPYFGGGSGSLSAGFMFNGASIEPTYNGGASRNSGVDFGSTNYRWKRGHFQDFCIGTTATPPGNGLVVGGIINPIGGIVGDTAVQGTIASNFTGQRWLLLDVITSGAGLVLYGDFVSASYTTELITKVYIRKDYNTNAVSATLTGVVKAGSGQTCYVQTVTYNGVNYVALSTNGGDPGWNASWIGFRLNAVWNFVTDGVTVVTTHATY